MREREREGERERALGSECGWERSERHTHVQYIEKVQACS